MRAGAGGGGRLTTDLLEAPVAVAPPVVHPTVRVALVGAPNCGKTALFNALTGARQKVANYSGVTVERKEGRLTAADGAGVVVIDLPGTYSLRARSPDEVVTRDAVLGRLPGEVAPDVVVCVADATNLRLVLRLALELRSVGRPMVLALNMIDIAERQGLVIDQRKLSEALGMPVVATVATRKRGVEALVEAAQAAPRAHPTEGTPDLWCEPSVADIRRLHREAGRIIRLAVAPPRRPDTWTGRLDDVLLHPVFGIGILLAMLFVMFQAVFIGAKPIMDLITAGFAMLGDGVDKVLPPGLLLSLIRDGIITGVGSVVVFLPQIAILFLFIILLEDVGYMARAAFLMDRLMAGAGLHGRAFIPLLSSFACAIPGIMATRVIDQKRDRLTTIMVAPLMTCSARIPVYTLIISAFIPRRALFGVISLQGLVFFGLYAAGIVSALLAAVVMRRIFWRGAAEPFLMELPAYKAPDALNVARGVLQRAEIFLKRAGTTILSMMILVWFLSTFPGAPAGATRPAIEYSFAGMIGHAIEPVMAPIGFSWQMAVALIPGMAAREVAVGALATVYAISGEGGLGASLARHWSLASALAFLAWYVFAPQCASTLAVVRRETNSFKWPLMMFGYMIVLAYGAAFLVYQAARLIGVG
jgi:ferrous iron transport protein B